jgi:hypothetical protein
MTPAQLQEQIAKLTATAAALVETDATRALGYTDEARKLLQEFFLQIWHAHYVANKGRRHG